MAIVAIGRQSGLDARDPRSGLSLLQLEQDVARFDASIRCHWSAEPMLATLPAPTCAVRLIHLLASLTRSDGRRLHTLCRRLAQGWRRRGAGPLHFDAGGAVLLRSLADALGEAFVDDEDRWAALYGEAVEAMLTVFADTHPEDPGLRPARRLQLGWQAEFRLRARAFSACAPTLRRDNSA